MTPRESTSSIGTKNRTTPEIELGFFRAWSLRPAIRPARSSDTVQSSEVSPGTTPAPKPPASAFVKTQRRAKRPNAQRLRSEPALTRLSNQGASTVNISPTPDTESVHDLEPVLPSKVSKESLGSTSISSQSSPAASTLRKLVRLSGHCVIPAAVKDVKPCRKSRDSSKGRPEIAGNITDSSIGRTPHPTEPHGSQEDYTIHTTGPTLSSPQAASASPKIGWSPGHQGVRRKSVSTAGPSYPPAGSALGFNKSAPVTPGRHNILWRWNKRRLGMKQRAEIRHQPELSPTRSLTGLLLQRASTVLKDFTAKKPSPTSSASSNLSIAASHSRQAYLTPLYRGHSNTSSIGVMHIGKAPLATPATPDSQLMYIGSDAERYYRVEISEPGAPTYLPSEARRIGTPPMSSHEGRHRGFFFDYNAPEDRGTTPNAEEGDSGFPSPVLTRKRVSDIDWYKVKLEADEAHDVTMNFELNVPDHLPSSPLCPKHPKHKSGGKGICIYHGRNRDVGDEA